MFLLITHSHSTMSREILYTIVIPTFNSEKILKNLLEDIFRERDLYPPSSIIIIDDCSTDDTKYLPKFFDSEVIPVDYIKLDKQIGPLLAEKVGIEEVDTEIFISIHADVRLSMQNIKISEHPIDAIACYLYKSKNERDENIAVVAPWTLQLSTPYLVQGGPRSINNDKCPFSMQRNYAFRPLVRAPTTRWESVLSTDAYCYAMFTEYYHEVGGFNEAYSPYFFYHDDLFARIREKGHKIITTTQKVVYHPSTSNHKTTQFLSKSDPDLFEKNLEYFISKWQDKPIWNWNSQYDIVQIDSLTGGFSAR